MSDAPPQTAHASERGRNLFLWHALVALAALIAPHGSKN